MKLITDPKYQFRNGYIYRIYWNQDSVIDNIYSVFSRQFFSEKGVIFDHEKMVDLAHSWAKFPEGKIVELCQGWGFYFGKLKEPFYLNITRKTFEVDRDLYEP